MQPVYACHFEPFEQGRWPSAEDVCSNRPEKNSSAVLRLGGSWGHAGAREESILLILRGGGGF